MATPNLRHLEWFHDHVRIEERFLDGFPTPEDGAIVPPGRRRVTAWPSGDPTSRRTAVAEVA